MMAGQPKVLEIPVLLKQEREELIESFRPNYNDSTTSENIIVLQERLYQDAKNSNLFLGFMDGLRNEYINDMNEIFTTNELYELRNILKNKLIVRLIKMEAETKENNFESRWSESNNKLITELMERQQEILKLRLEDLENSSN